VRAGAERADDERPAQEAEQSSFDKAFHEEALQNEMKRLHMVPAAAPAVFSRGLRHVSLCFEGSGKRRRRIFTTISAFSPSIICVSSYQKRSACR
jgi:hypothetical protein